MPSHRREEQISLVGRAWLKRNRISLKLLEREARQSFLGNSYILRPPFDRKSRQPVQYDEYQDRLIRYGDRWTLRHWVGNIGYEEHKNGHGKLTILDCHLSDQQCRALYKSNLALSTVVDLPEKSIIRASGGTIISARVKDSYVMFLLRVRWSRWPRASGSRK